MLDTPRESVVRQDIERFRTKLANLRIPPDIRYVRMTDIERALTIYGHRANLLNNKCKYIPMYLLCSWLCQLKCYDFVLFFQGTLEAHTNGKHTFCFVTKECVLSSVISWKGFTIVFQTRTANLTFRGNADSSWFLNCATCLISVSINYLPFFEE